MMELFGVSFPCEMGSVVALRCCPSRMLSHTEFGSLGLFPWLLVFVGRLYIASASSYIASNVSSNNSDSLCEMSSENLSS